MNPEKKALVLFWALPVLPATGRAPSDARPPVPSVMTPRSMATVRVEIFSSMTRLHSGLFSIRGLRSPGATTLVIE